MKRAFFVLFLIVNLQSFAFGKTIIKEEKCTRLASDVSIVAFSFDTNGMLYAPYQLQKGKGIEYIDKTRTALNHKMVEFCQSEKAGVFIEEFRDKFHGACSNECQEQSSIFKDPLIGTNSMKMNADTVCLSICNKTKDKLDMFIEGIDLGKNLTKKGSGECGASISNSGRGVVKTKDFDTIIENVKSSSAIQK